ATASSSPWSSEEGREFLQERLARFSRFIFFVATAFFFGVWLTQLAWDPSALDHGFPIRTSALFHLAGISIVFAMWMLTRGPAVRAERLRVIESLGVFFLSLAMLGRAFTLSTAFRPDSLAMLSLFALLLYRAAVIPSEPARTARIGITCVALVPILSFIVYSRAARPDLPSPWFFAAFSLLFAVLAVVLSTTTSSIIYGLRQTVREARKLGPYTLVEKIGAGGMGAVYRAQHALLRRPTAVKILPPERAGEMDLARFEREVQMTALLTSPHTVSIYDYGKTPDGVFYYAMEFLDGIDLNELVQRDGPMPPGRVVHVLRQVSEALAEAHRSGLIHRDVKPANILLSERGGRPDFAKVLDFGLVKSVSSTSAAMTADNVLLGTPYYMAPEAVRSPEQVDARSDLYSLGATGYFLLTGKAVFEGTSADILASLLRDRPQPPSKRLGRPIPASLETLLLQTLSKDPDQRPESMEAFAAALASCQDVTPWSEADAAAWWKSRLSLVRSARTDSSDMATAPTLSVGREARPAK
ncbi:MAG TPA: serine/threonine-protein kinase, partial [Thermoanaerobaculia bacterium]